ncbi:MAG: hypothetical protein KIT56_05215 [Gammaproteobacteria bacterium]|nr:hypothetical protein [Gammaproteobacteria bacterium]MCW5583274.1 hypothetical protein [Gammaproteobacteria bacterium]
MQREDENVLYEPFTRRQESARVKPTQRCVCFVVDGEEKYSHPLAAKNSSCTRWVGPVDIYFIEAKKAEIEAKY